MFNLKICFILPKKVKKKKYTKKRKTNLKLKLALLVSKCIYKKMITTKFNYLKNKKLLKKKSSYVFFNNLPI